VPCTPNRDAPRTVNARPLAILGSFTPDCRALGVAEIVAIDGGYLTGA
jgi:hypothetical protein